MTRASRECRVAERDMARGEHLDAVERARLEVHLNRCHSCRALADRVAAMEKGPERDDGLTDERRAEIYRRLLPAIYEISRSLSAARQPSWLRPAVGLTVAAALAAVAIFVTRLSPVDETSGTASAPPAAIAAASKPDSIEALVDRCEGSVLVSGTPADRIESFRATVGTTIDVGPGSGFVFRLDESLRVALDGETAIRMSRVATSSIEIAIEHGRMAAALDSGAGTALAVMTPDSMVRVKGTVFAVVAVPGERTDVFVEEGRVEVVTLSGPARTLTIDAGKSVSVPGDLEAKPDRGETRDLTAEVDPEVDPRWTESRLVRFDGSPERVRVEVDGRVIGTTPLSVRLPAGPISYRLTAPGMEPLAGTLADDSPSNDIGFALAPAAGWRPDPARKRVETSTGRSTRLVERGTGSSAGWDLLERARAAATAGDLPYAIGLLERAASGEEGDRLVRTLSLLADCYTAAGRYREAADTFVRVVALAPDAVAGQNARYETGRLAMDRLGDPERARAAFTAYLASPVGGALREEAFYSFCEIEGRQAAHRSALRCFDDFLSVFPDSRRRAEARLWRGALVQDVERRWMDAERDLVAFLQAKPRHPRAEEARYRTALGRFHLGDRRGALRMIDEYLAEHPDGQYRTRVERLRRAILDPGFSWEQEKR